MSRSFIRGISVNRTKRLLATVIVCGTLGVGLWMLWVRIAAADPVFLTTTSPAQTYTVSIAGQKDRPRFPAIVNTVTFSVTKRSETFLGSQYLHSGDWLDPSFSILYPQHNWPSENVLHFFREEYFSGGEPLRLIVKNSSGETIKYLLVVSHDAHLLFDVQANSKTELKIPPPRGDIFYISVEGQFTDGRAQKRVGQNFIVNKRPATFYVDVGDTAAAFESTGWEKYTPK